MVQCCVIENICRSDILQTFFSNNFLILLKVVPFTQAATKNFQRKCFWFVGGTSSYGENIIANHYSYTGRGVTLCLTVMAFRLIYVGKFATTRNKFYRRLLRFQIVL